MSRNNAVQAEGTDQDTASTEPSVKNYKQYLLPFGIYLLIALVIFWPVTLNITNTVAAGGLGFPTAGNGDVYQNLWNLWWTGYSIFTLHTTLYFTHLLYYPVGASLVTQTLSPIAALLSIPLQAVSLGFAYNVIFFMDFALAGLFMFLLADYLLKNKYAAFIAGIVFDFSPFHMVHSLGQLNWTSIEFVPLFILLFLLMIREKKPIIILCAAVSFVLLFFFGDPEQAIICTVFVFLLFLLSLIRSEDRKMIIDRKLPVAIIAMVVLIIVIGSPLFIPLVQGVMNGALNQANAANPLPGNLVWSDPLLSYFIPSPFNNFFSAMDGQFFPIYEADAGERVAYLGYTVLLLCAIAVINDARRNRLRNSGIWVIVGLIAAWLSLGPYLQVGALPAQIDIATAIPGIYLLYSHLPILDIVREPARFDMIVTLCLAILAGLGFIEIEQYIKNRPNGGKNVIYAASIITLLILIEYTGIPFTSQYVNAYFLKLSIPSGYYQIANVPGNFSVMVLPSLETSNLKPELYLGTQMYYQTAFHKPLISGYTSRVNATEEYPRVTMPLSLEASALQNGGSFSYPSPVSQNDTNVTLFFLSKYNTRFVSVINSAYNASDLIELNSYLDSVFGTPFYQDSSSTIYEVNQTVASEHADTVIAYSSRGSWIYGCGAPVLCNSTFNTFWWGSNIRAVNVSVPENNTELTLLFTVVPYNQNVSLAVFLDSDQHRLGVVTLQPEIVTYNLNLTLPQGLSELFFVSPNSTSPQAVPGYNFGIKNITFEKR